MTTTSIHLRNITDGYAEVWYGGHIIGTVERIKWPHEVNGFVEIEQRWEIRTPHNFGIVSPYSFPTAPTRREAINYLAEEY